MLELEADMPTVGSTMPSCPNSDVRTPGKCCKRGGRPRMNIKKNRTLCQNTNVK